MSTPTRFKSITSAGLEGVLVEFLDHLIEGSFGEGTDVEAMDEARIAARRDFFVEVKRVIADGSGPSWIHESLLRHAVPLSSLETEWDRSTLMLFDAADSQERDLVHLLEDHLRSREDFSALVDLLTPPQVPSTAVVEQARRNAQLRVQFLNEFETVSSRELAKLARSRSKNRSSLAYNWRSQHLLFSIPVGREQRYPLFQIDSETVAPKPVIAGVLEPLLEAGLSGWQLALWFAGPLASLGDRRPVDLIDTDPELAVSAARAVAMIPQ